MIIIINLYKNIMEKCFSILLFKKLLHCIVFLFIIEFKSLNDQLDQLNQVLDTLETRNDNIHAELVELLKSNKEARHQFQSSAKNEEA